MNKIDKLPDEYIDASIVTTLLWDKIGEIIDWQNEMVEKLTELNHAYDDLRIEFYDQLEANTPEEEVYEEDLVGIDSRTGKVVGHGKRKSYISKPVRETSFRQQLSDIYDGIAESYYWEGSYEGAPEVEEARQRFVDEIIALHKEYGGSVEKDNGKRD